MGTDHGFRRPIQNKHKMSCRQAVLLFVKAPVRGQVKSRLARALGRQLAREAYEHFSLDIVRTIRKYPFRIFFSPSGSGTALTHWLGNDLVYIPQRGRDLGKRMENAFIMSFSDGIEKAVLIGSDIPDLKAGVINEAFSALDKNDAVIGPASDGGYYLIGFRKDTFVQAIFKGIKWSSDSVFRETIRIFKKLGSKVNTLPEWRDVDTVEDLRALILRNRTTGFRNSDTMLWAMENRERIFQSRVDVEADVLQNL